MKNSNRVSIAGAFIGAVAVACGGTTTDDMSLPREASVSSDGTLAASESAGAGTEAPSAEPESPYLFRDPNTSGPTLEVIEAGGNIGVSVGGPIGTEGDVLPLLRPDSSLVELYRALHPTEAEVPSELEALDQRVGPVMADLIASARAEAPRAAIVEKSESQFRSTVCKIFRDPTFQYTPVSCPWFSSTTTVFIDDFDSTIRSGDRVYGWNAASTQAQIEFHFCSSCNPDCSCSVVFTSMLAPATWRAAWMTGGGPYAALVKAPGGVNGERGGTHHALSTIIR